MERYRSNGGYSYPQRTRGGWEMEHPERGGGKVGAWWQQMQMLEGKEPCGGPESVIICHRRALLTPPQTLPPRIPGHSRQLKLIHTWRLLVLTYVCNHYHPHNQDRNSFCTSTTPLRYPSVVTPFPTPNPGHQACVLCHNRFVFLRLSYQWSHTASRL